MVAIISCPSECKLREVARTHDKTAQLVAEVHEQLCALASLRVLVGDIMDCSIVADVLEVLCDGLCNIDFTQGDTKTLHEGECVVIGAVGGTEARHRDADDTLTVVAQLVEHLHTDEQG